MELGSWMHYFRRVALRRLSSSTDINRSCVCLLWRLFRSKRDIKMETRKKRATELIEKCDVKVFSSTERTQVVQVYDRRVKIDFGDSALDNTSLYSVLRSWVQDDPDKHPPDDTRVRKQQRHRPTISSYEDTIAVVKEKKIHYPLNLDSKVGIILYSSCPNICGQVYSSLHHLNFT